jgi:hypothetical protein
LKKNLNFFVLSFVSLFFSHQSFASKNVYWVDVDEFACFKKNSQKASEGKVEYLGTGGFAGCVGVGVHLDNGVGVAHLKTPPSEYKKSYYDENLPQVFGSLFNEAKSYGLGSVKSIDVFSGEGYQENLSRSFVKSALSKYLKLQICKDGTAGKFAYPIFDKFEEFNVSQIWIGVVPIKRFNINSDEEDYIWECKPDFTSMKLKGLH